MRLFLFFLFHSRKSLNEQRFFAFFALRDKSCASNWNGSNFRASIWKNVLPPSFRRQRKKWEIRRQETRAIYRKRYKLKKRKSKTWLARSTCLSQMVNMSRRRIVCTQDAFCIHAVSKKHSESKTGFLGQIRMQTRKAKWLQRRESKRASAKRD